jgi:hypothetical protein
MRKRKSPAFRQDLPGLAIPRQELAASSSLLTGLLALTVRVLLLLAGLVAATLLLTRLLARILILLTRVLVLAGHWNLLNLVRFGTVRDNAETSGLFLENPGYGLFRRDRELTAKTPLHKPLKPHLALLPHPVPAVRK